MNQHCAFKAALVIQVKSKCSRCWELMPESMGIRSKLLYCTAQKFVARHYNFHRHGDSDRRRRPRKQKLDYGRRPREMFTYALGRLISFCFYGP